MRHRELQVFPILNQNSNYTSIKASSIISNSIISNIIIMKKSILSTSSITRSTLDYFTVFHTIGSGSSAKVKLVQDSYTLQFYAAKIIKLNNKLTPFHYRASLGSEVRIMRKLSHKHIIKLVDHHESGTYVSKSKGFYKCMYLVLEHCAIGDLFKLVKKNGPLTQDLSRYFFGQMVESLRYLHGQDLIHGDLKPENFVISDSFELKLIDFNLTFHSNESKYLGSERYLPPEARSNRPASYKSDLFALGVVLFIISFGSPPFNKASEDDAFYCLLKTNPKGFWNYFERKKPEAGPCPGLKALIEGLLHHNPEERWGYEQIQQNSWASFAFDTVKVLESAKDLVS